jgi:beta-glucanase (GH16 family)
MRQIPKSLVAALFVVALVAPVGCVGGAENGTPANSVDGSTPNHSTSGSPDGSKVPGGVTTNPSSDAGTGSDDDAGGGGPTPPASTPTIFQQFDGWNGTTSPDGIWRIAGVWTGTGNNTLEPGNGTFMSSYGGAAGVLLLTSRANSMRGGEIQTLPTYGYGYYETSMRVSSTPGVCDSFFWMEENYGSHEWDVEFLTNESWISSANSGQVHLTLHPSEKAYVLSLPFNPSKDFHRYGFLWKPGTIDFTVDGKVLHSFADGSLNTTVQGYIMMNSWTGNPNWGGGPPTQDAVTAYDWVKYYANASAIP